MKNKYGNLLKYATRFWFIVTFLGQMIFVYYILMLYWKSMALGQPEKWNATSAHAYVEGDIRGNIIFGSHVLLAAIITILGPLQLVTSMRARAPRFHRISGRIYIISAFLISIAGIYLTWVRGTVGGPMMAITITINGAIILTCAFFTIRSAMQRRFGVHNQWAVHLFLGMSGVWLFRVFLMLWLFLHRGPAGFNPKTFTGPFLTFLSVFVYIFPQVVVALYFKAKSSDSSFQKVMFSLFLIVITLGIVVGSIAATAGMWLPRLK